MPRERNQDRDQGQSQKGRNPGNVTTEDEEVDADPVRADQQPLSEEQRQALGRSQEDRRRRPEENIEQVEDEEAEDDEDESDGISQRP